MNSAAGNAGTVHPLVRTERGSLQLRVLSAVTLAPFPIAAIWFGWPWLPLLTAIAAAVMAWNGGGSAGGAIWPDRDRACRGRTRRGRRRGARLCPSSRSVTALIGAGIVFWAARKKRDLEPRWTALRRTMGGAALRQFAWLARDGPIGAPPFYGYSPLSGRPTSAHTQLDGCSVARAWHPAGAHGKLGLGLRAALSARRWRGGLPCMAWHLSGNAIGAPHAGLAIVGQFGDLADPC